jgi:hypothetical protein
LAAGEPTSTSAFAQWIAKAEEWAAPVIGLLPDWLQPYALWVAAALFAALAVVTVRKQGAELWDFGLGIWRWIAGKPKPQSDATRAAAGV